MPSYEVKSGPMLAESWRPSLTGRRFEDGFFSGEVTESFFWNLDIPPFIYGYIYIALDTLIFNWLSRDFYIIYVMLLNMGWEIIMSIHLDLAGFGFSRPFRRVLGSDEHFVKKNMWIKNIHGILTWTVINSWSNSWLLAWLFDWCFFFLNFGWFFKKHIF